MEQEQLLFRVPALLLEWYDREARVLPWRENTDPYRVWVSEIMLQPTRVEAVMPYYERFLSAFPTLADLAAAPEEHLLKLWEGLGYYSLSLIHIWAADQALDDQFVTTAGEYGLSRWEDVYKRQALRSGGRGDEREGRLL